MNYLPLLIIAFLLFSDKKRTAELLSGFTLDDLLPLLPLLGIEQSTAELIVQLLPQLLSGEGDIKALLKGALPLFASLSQTSPGKEHAAEQGEQPDFLAVNDIANEQIAQSLKSYFS